MGDFPPFSLQGLPGNYPPYPITPQSMGMGPPPWSLLMNGGMAPGSAPPPVTIPGENYTSVSPSTGVKTDIGIPTISTDKGINSSMTLQCPKTGVYICKFLK